MRVTVTSRGVEPCWPTSARARDTHLTWPTLYSEFNSCTLLSSSFSNFVLNFSVGADGGGITMSFITINTAHLVLHPQTCRETLPKAGAGLNPTALLKLLYSWAGYGSLAGVFLADDCNATSPHQIFAGGHAKELEGFRAGCSVTASWCRKSLIWSRSSSGPGIYFRYANTSQSHLL